MNRRQFLINTGLAAGGLFLPRFFDRALAFVENHGEPLIEAPSNAANTLNIRFDDAYVFYLGDPAEYPPPAPTFREWFIMNGQDIEKWAEEWELEPGGLNEPVPEDHWVECWVLNHCSNARAFSYLRRLDLGPDFGTAGSDAAGELRFQDCPGMCSTYTAVETDDLLSISLLQNRLNELGENTRVDLSNMRKSRWEQS